MKARLLTWSMFALSLPLSGCAAPEPSDSARTALAIEQEHGLQVFVADGPQSCASPSLYLVVGPSCDSPSWQLVFSVPHDAQTGEIVDLHAPPPSPELGVQFGMQGGECHSGEPSLDSAFVHVGQRTDSTFHLQLDVDARSSFDPSGSYVAKICD